MAPDNAGGACGSVAGAGWRWARGRGARPPWRSWRPKWREIPPIDRAQAALELAKDKPDDGELEALRKAAAERPADMDAQFAFAAGRLCRRRSRDEAADTLLR